MVKRKNRSTLPTAAIIFVLTLASAACNGINEDSSLSFINEDGRHPAGWLQAHGSFAQFDAAKCEACHGSLNDELHSGGTSRVSCFSVSFNGQSCHGSGESFHPDGWIPDHVEQALPDGGSCTSCHGRDLDGGITSVSCYAGSSDGQACHVLGPAFHPANWLDKSSRGTLDWHGDAYGSGQLINGVPCETCHTPPALDALPGGKCVQCHFDTDGSNSPDPSWDHGTLEHDRFLNSPEADVCVNCHEVSDRFGYGPSFTGCYDCHGVHPSDWAGADIHGSAAKSRPGTDAGFSNCQVCHGSEFNGTPLARSCDGSGCHGTFNNSDAIPHPAGSRWENETFPTHRNTDEGNALVCADCHREILAPAVGCRNNNQCHDD